MNGNRILGDSRRVRVRGGEMSNNMIVERPMMMVMLLRRQTRVGMLYRCVGSSVNKASILDVFVIAFVVMAGPITGLKESHNGDIKKVFMLAC